MNSGNCFLLFVCCAVSSNYILARNQRRNLFVITNSIVVSLAYTLKCKYEKRVENKFDLQYLHQHFYDSLEIFTHL